LKAGETEKIKALQGPSIMAVTGGEGIMRAERKEHKVKEGCVFFIGYSTEIEFVAASGLETHIAFAKA
jgi:mannose-6-phosphate isomerase